jgi:hypothetical protein
MKSLRSNPCGAPGALGITHADGEFMMPVRTVLIVGCKVAV